MPPGLGPDEPLSIDRSGDRRRGQSAERLHGRYWDPTPSRPASSRPARVKFLRSSLPSSAGASPSPDPFAADACTVLPGVRLRGSTLRMILAQALRRRRPDHHFAGGAPDGSAREIQVLPARATPGNRRRMFTRRRQFGRFRVCPTQHNRVIARLDRRTRQACSPMTSLRQPSPSCSGPPHREHAFCAGRDPLHIVLMSERRTSDPGAYCVRNVRIGRAGRMRLTVRCRSPPTLRRSASPAT